MPKKTPSTGWYHQPFLWRAASAGMLIVCRCRECRRTVTYLAADLAPLYHRDAVVGRLWGACPALRPFGWLERAGAAPE